MPRWTVDAGTIVGMSPMELPDRCVKCGRYVPGGRRVEATLYWYPRRIWWGPFIVYAYVLERRPLEISYSLCPQHDRSLERRQQAALGLWALFVALLIAAFATQGNRICLVAAFALFIAALIVQTMARLPLWAASHDDGVFGVKGFGKDFLAAVAGPDASATAKR